MGLILLEDMEFYGYHGCFKEERMIGTNFMVNLELETDTSMAEKSDNLHDTVDYKAIHDSVKQEMQIPSKLLENVAHRIIERIMSEFQTISKITIKVAKLNPPMGSKMKSVSVKISKTR